MRCSRRAAGPPAWWQERQARATGEEVAPLGSCGCARASCILPSSSYAHVRIEPSICWRRRRSGCPSPLHGPLLFSLQKLSSHPSCCCPPPCSARSFFMCRIDLTDEGHAHVKEAVAVVFRSGAASGSSRVPGTAGSAAVPPCWGPAAPAMRACRSWSSSLVCMLPSLLQLLCASLMSCPSAAARPPIFTRQVSGFAAPAWRREQAGVG